MTAFLRKRFLPLLSALALAAAILCPVAPVAAAPHTARLTGVPSNVSLLFAIEFKAGTLKPDRHAGKARYILTLSGLKQMGTWFSDRPARDAGRVNVAQLFRSWGALGFAAIAPNAAVILESAPANRDAMAVELHLRSFDRRTETVTFAIRALGSLGHGLATLNRRLGLRPARRFSSGSLFIDNAAYPGDCTLGQPQLMAIGSSIASSHSFNSLLPADGQLLPINSNEALYSVYGTRFGGNGTTTFAVPNMPSPSGTTWFVCSSGVYPDPTAMSECTTGQINYLISPFGTGSDFDGWWPADGRTFMASQVPGYAAAYAPGASQVTLPTVSAPAGMQAYVCIAPEALPLNDELGEIELFQGNPWFTDLWDHWVPANGESLAVANYQELYALLDNKLSAFVAGTLSQSTASFSVPSVGAPVSGLSWWIATEGYWPQSS